jgi:hypothetical protein
MYENRIVAFIDILGFGALVEESAENDDVAKSILSALTSMLPENLQKIGEATLNYDLIPADEIAEADAALAKLNENAKDLYQINISFFSDCVVFSALTDNVMSKQMLLDIVGKFSMILWSQNKLLLRGGITVGKLYHVNGGPVFGPAMNRAYYLESKLAKSPRILIDSECVAELRRDTSFKIFESFIQEDESGDFYSSLSTIYRHFINDSSFAFYNAPELKELKSEFFSLIEVISERITQFDDDRIKEKYNWMLNDVALITEDIKP